MAGDLNNRPPEFLPASALGKRLAILLALAVILLLALAWMTVALLDATDGLSIDPLTFTATNLEQIGALLVLADGETSVHQSGVHAGRALVSDKDGILAVLSQRHGFPDPHP
ncbi:hypothetical protein C5748_12070 [Phyllobacterium phragmitis]|uniref:Uncharacterized protein n=1 Tax=Phyllobacterium phragmitis TaxID=2670329 RepID=A0A2S9ISB9_9HYPH|nr:hypothetical protein [Phyllobacterium phragmitis]PRD43418.1 hypothetical protein C5748_12070 [Phyllobacterium phragmitis]